MKSGRHLGRHDHAERLQLGVDVLAELPARVPDDVLTHDDPVEVVKWETVFDPPKIKIKLSQHIQSCFIFLFLLFKYRSNICWELLLCCMS